MLIEVTILFTLLHLASTFYEYTPETFPDSIEQPQACNMHEASFLCDPSNVLSKGNLTANREKLWKSVSLENIRDESI
ncbi:hypothetical protein KIN20_027879 [Parelaphostrongylus tenuis]|uniref:Uncharacterized protein n=1 Tax=Parelaphostrongylus tenuis TaxID=148309 RepID=A0AAD5WE55_PARTN|nr:hypothetical protein KIN20_027879 [Parelaphostrongylus tenuis]